jgi:predicted permease
MTPLIWRVVERRLASCLPPDRLAPTLGDLSEDFAKRCRSDGRLRGQLWLLSETQSLVAAYKSENSRRSTTALLRSIRSDFRWAWRGVRARGWRAVLIVALLAVALAANTLVFAAADALVFHRVPYREPSRIVEIQAASRPGGPGSSQMSAAVLDEWRKQTDLFSGVHAYLTKTVFLTGDGVAEVIPTADVTPGLIELLGRLPRWGRALVEDDAHQSEAWPVLIGEDLATKRFGSPSRALGRRIETTAQPLVVVGVMPTGVRFPYGATRIWRALDPRGPLTQGFSGVSSIARVAPGVSMEQLAGAMKERSPTIGQTAGRHGIYNAFPAGLRLAASSADDRKLFYVLLGAALCLLLTACANVASLELVNAVARARTHAIQIALGASRGTLARLALFEGAALVGLAVLAAIGLGWFGSSLLMTLLSDRVRFNTLKPIALDGRALTFMAIAASVTWLLASGPLLFRASRSTLMGLLKLEDRGSASSRGGALARRALTVAEVALAVLLLIGGVLYARTYRALLALDKGFDAANVLQVSAALPPQSLGNRPVLVAQMIERLKGVSGVIAAVDEQPPPSFDSPTGEAKVEIDDQPPTDEGVNVTVQPVGSDYFAVLQIPLKSGRFFGPHEPPNNALVTDRFARRFWEDGTAVGHRFRIGPGRPWQYVIGVVGDIRSDDEVPGRASFPWLLAFSARQPAPPPKPMSPDQVRAMASGGFYGELSLMVRVDGMSRADAVAQAARSVDPRVRITVESVDESYAKAHAATLLATRVIGGFGALAFLVAIAGIYGVMAFLVTSRTREIGVRMALGAGRSDISRLILGSSGRLVLMGAVLGLGTALAVSRAVRSQLFGITPTDPVAYTIVTLSVMATALLATWHPTRQAARVDPAITLRSE